jgi:Ca2+:H+ antiporter
LTSPDLARILQAARDRASAARHAFVGTEHLLVAVLEDPDGAAARALTAAGLTSHDGLADELLVGLPVASADAAEPPPLSRFAERAMADAEKAGSNLALVLLRAPRGRLASVLARRGLKLPELKKALEPDPPEPQVRTPKPPKPPKPARPARSAPSASSASSASPAPSAPPRRAERRPQDLVADEPPRERRLPPHLDTRRRQSKPGRKIPWSLILLLAVPASIVLNAQHASPLLIFGAACLGVLPLAGLMGRATEQIAERTGPTIGGLLNATFGNAAELIIAIVALRAGLVDLVKASITGSILGNLLLILGLSLVAGGVKAPILKFNRTSAGMSSAMLALAVAGLVFPAVFHTLHPGLAGSELALSEKVAIILAITYGCSLLFSLHTHKSVFGMDASSTPEGPEWSLFKSVGVLALATAAVVVESEILVHAVEGVTQSLGLSEVFLGLIIIPVIGNAAEHASAVLMARKGKTDLALQIALGSSTQVALLVAPILVLAGVLIGQPMNLVFTSFEVITLAVSTIVVSMITLDGESHWFEGVQLLALYAMVAAAAYFL